jgi:hypothetical protein
MTMDEFILVFDEQGQQVRSPVFLTLTEALDLALVVSKMPGVERSWVETPNGALVAIAVRGVITPARWTLANS